MILTREGLFEDIVLHRCRACLALWADPEALDRLDENINVDASRLAWRPIVAGTAYRCPACPGGYRESGPALTACALDDPPTVVMHRCQSCDGLLLDEQTLDQIRSAVVSATPC